MNRKTFFDIVRRDLFGGSMSQAQVEGCSRILDYRASNWPKMIDEELAYILATTKWETGHSMQPIEEGYPLTGEKLRRFQRGLRYAPFYGRGLAQVTWESNYRKFGIEKPEDALTWPVALRVLFEGSIKGMFTGHKLADYISKSRQDYVGARRIINGTDKAEKIADYAKSFLVALKRADDGTEEPMPAAELCEMQRLLAGLGYALGRTDGVYAELTAGAVARFQWTNKLPITGVLDAVTVRKLKSKDALRSQVIADREQATEADLPDSRTIVAAQKAKQQGQMATGSLVTVVLSWLGSEVGGGNTLTFIGMAAALAFLSFRGEQNKALDRAKAARLDDFKRGRNL